MPDQALTTRDQTTAPADQRRAPPQVVLRHELDRMADQFKMVLPAHISPEKFQRTVMTAVQATPKLLGAHRGTLFQAAMKAAQDGLLPDGREAALVIFNTKIDNQWQDAVQYMPMVYGLRKKILQSGEISDLQVGIVYRAELDSGAFVYEIGSVPPLQHRPSMTLTAEETADSEIVAAYSIATMKDGTKSYEVMRRFEIDKVRQASKTGAVGTTDRSGKEIKPKGPWVDWFAEMAKKTVMRRHSKTLPMSGDIIDVEAADQAEAARSAAYLLHTQPPQDDRPRSKLDVLEDSITGNGAATFDATTGEIIDQVQPSDTRTDSPGEAAESPSQTAAEPSEAAANEGASEGANRIPADATPVKVEAARRIIFRYRECDTVIDLNSAKAERKADYDALDEDLQKQVDGAFEERMAILKKAKGK